MSDPTAQRERDEAERLIREARSVLDTAESENRATTGEEDARFERLVDAVNVHKRRANTLDGMALEAETLGTAIRSRIGEHRSGAATTGSTNVHDQIRTMIEAGETRAEFAFPETRVITDFGSGDDLYTADFATRVAVYERTMSPWFRLPTIINATNGRDLVIGMVTGDPAASATGEGTAITDATPTLDHATATMVKYSSYGTISAEALEDAEYNITDIIARTAARSVALLFSAAATTAIVSGASNGGTATGLGGYGTAVGAFLGYEDLMTLKFATPEPYRQAASWVAANSALSKISRWRDGNGWYLWDQTAVGAPILGAPVFEEPNLSSIGSASKSILYGDFAAGVAVRQMPLKFSLSRDVKFQEDLVAWKVTHRLAVAVQDPKAIRYLVAANS